MLSSDVQERLVGLRYKTYVQRPITVEAEKAGQAFVYEGLVHDASSVLRRRPIDACHCAEDPERTGREGAAMPIRE